MKTARTLIALVVGPALLLAGCGAPPEKPTVDLAAEKAAIEKLLKDQLAGVNQPGPAGADGYVSVMSDDVVALPPNGGRVEGRQAVRDWSLQFTSSPGWSVTWKASRIDIAASGDLAYAIGEVSRRLQERGGRELEDDGPRVQLRSSSARRARTQEVGPLQPPPGVERSAGHAQRRGSYSGYAVLRDEKAPDDALARELGAMGL